jgi:DNA-binding XRE family transcriptional regulator
MSIDITPIGRFRTPAGDDLVILPAAEFDRLHALAKAAEDEDAADARVAKDALAALAEGREVALPSDVTMKIVDGENPVRVLREWRGFTQTDLCSAAGISQPYLSQIEGGRRKGGDYMKRIARALNVPLDILVVD